MKQYQLLKGTPFYIKSDAIPDISGLPIQLSQNFTIYENEIAIGKCDCGNCNTDVATIAISNEFSIVCDAANIKADRLQELLN